MESLKTKDIRLGKKKNLQKWDQINKVETANIIKLDKKNSGDCSQQKKKTKDQK